MPPGMSYVVYRCLHLAKLDSRASADTLNYECKEHLTNILGDSMLTVKAMLHVQKQVQLAEGQRELICLQSVSARVSAGGLRLATFNLWSVELEGRNSIEVELEVQVWRVYTIRETACSGHTARKCGSQNSCQSPSAFTVAHVTERHAFNLYTPSILESNLNPRRTTIHPKLRAVQASNLSRAPPRDNKIQTQMP